MTEEVETIIDIILEDLEDDRISRQEAVNKIAILMDQEVTAERKYTFKKWFIIGIMLGMVIIRILEFLLPNA